MFIFYTRQQKIDNHQHTSATGFGGENLVRGADINVTTLICDDEVAGEFGGAILNHEFQLGFALVLDAQEVERGGQALQHLANGSLNAA